MKKITRRAVLLLLIAALTVAGLVVYTLRYIDHGEEWALAFSRANSGASGALLDRNGLVLARFDANGSYYADDAVTRMANYAVTGDYWGRSGTGALSNFWNDMQGYSLLTGTTHAGGSELRLNIDAALNRRAYEALDGRSGAVLLMNYRTGELLCMVSGPAVDPLDSGEPPEGAFLNKGLSSCFTPGSVFKLVTAAAAIEQIPDLAQRRFDCAGETEIAGVKIKCSGRHGTQTFEEALANSCNVAFAALSVELGHGTLLRYARELGFLDRHALDGIPSAAGSYPAEFDGNPELAWSGIGQSTDLVNPYAMLRYVAAIANGGLLAEPRLLADGARASTRLLNGDTADKLAGMMHYNAVSHYDAARAFPGLEIAAKTGTAELGDGSSHAWFVGFLLDEEHPYAFVVLVERGGGGLFAAGPVANAVLQTAAG